MIEVQFIRGDGTRNNATLSYEPISPTKIKLWHSNLEDGEYSYPFYVSGTKEEIDIIKEFCNKIESSE